MRGDIYLVAAGGRAGDIYLTNIHLTNPCGSWPGSSASATCGSATPTALSCYTICGRVVATDGTPRGGLKITVFERRSLTLDAVVAKTTTDARGTYKTQFALPPSSTWDVFVRAEDTQEAESVDSVLLSDLEEGTHIVDLVLGEGAYEGSTEWERITIRTVELLGETSPQYVPADRLEWLAKRADIFPMHLAAYVQAHRLADGLVAGRDVKPETFYALLRSGLPADMRGLLRAGEVAWESALRDGWSRHVVPQPGDGTSEDLDDEVAAEIAKLRELLLDALVATPTSGINQRVVLDTSGLSAADQRIFAGLWLDHEGPIEDFWTTVAGSSLSGEVDLLKFTVHAATLVGTHIETLEALQAERSAPISSISTLSDTAAWSVSDWDARLVTHSVTPPDYIPGSGTTQRQNYARTLFNIVEDAFPSRSLGASIAAEGSPPPSTEFVATFLTNNPDFDIVESTVGHYLNGASSPWTGIDPGDQVEARANLETVQRVYRMTPRIGRWATTKVLLDEGITSATQVVASTRTEFAAKFGPLFVAGDHDGDALAFATWDNAAKIHATVVAMASQLALAKTNADFVPVAMPGSELFNGAENGLAELSAILGGLDYCACEHCRSVFSPAAYLADLLAYLEKRPAEESDHALEVLLARRPDLPHILLDCTNTNTILPYIDLVNELLEDYIDGGLAATSKQTTWTAAELKLHPEHLDITVYEGTTMTQTVHPWTLPFSLPTVEAQTYLRHLGVPRHELMRRFAPKTPDAAFLNAMAGDLLGLDANGFDIVAGLYTGNESGDDREYWGFSDGSGDDDWVGVLNGTAETGGDVRELLLRGRLELDELRELLDLDFIDPDGSVDFQWDESCDLSAASITFETDATPHRLHRFVRLQRATKIPNRALNVLLSDVLDGTLDQANLRTLADIVRLRDRLKLPWDDLATFWANVIDARDYEKEPRSLYTRRFLGKDFGSVDPDFVPDEGDPTTLSGETEPAGAITTERLPRVLAGLGIKERDYQLLINADAGLVSSNDFTFANLTALYRCVVFARALRLSIEDFVRLAGPTDGLTALHPFTSPSVSLAFAEQIAAIKHSDFSVNELDWLLRHQWVGKDPLDGPAIGRALGDLARGMNTIEAEVVLLADPDGQGLATNLPEVIDSADVAMAITIVELAVVLTSEHETFIGETFGGFLDVELAKDVLYDSGDPKYLADVSLRRAWLLGKVVGHLRRRALVLDTVAREFGLSATVATVLVDDVLSNPADDSQSLFEVYRLPFATEAQVADGLTPSSHANAFAAWTKLAKAAMVCARFKMSVEQIAFYSEGGGWLELDGLPLDGDDPDATFESWERLRKALALRDLSRPDEFAPAEIANETTLAAAIAILADHAGWDAAALLAVVGGSGMGYGDADAAALAAEILPERLRVIVDTADRLGVALDVLFAWATSTPTMAQTTEIKAATRAKYGEDRWPDVGKPLRDDIRERQRDALVDAAIAITPSFHTSNDVFEHLLIDVEMSHCMMTSRIKQAIASVQIFVHRVLLHLEVEDVAFDAEAVERWGWMKNYRVWEANRKVFLYPENWIEPQLRRDKTPEFQELESTLMQGVLDQHRVEKALAAYLEKLARVANLEIVSTHQSPTTKDLWLLARTHGTPHEWFVRRRLASGEWEAWEAVPHNIDSNAAVLVFKKGRLHLFWANEHEVATTKEDAIPVNYTIGHLERSPDGWSKATVSAPNNRRFLPQHSQSQYRLVFGIDGRYIYLCILWHNRYVFESRVGLAGRFKFDPLEQRVRPIGGTLPETFAFDEEYDFGDAGMVPVTALTNNADVPLPANWEFEGQRNVKFFRHEADAGHDDVSTARLHQGSANVLLFDRASSGRWPGFLHQADMIFNQDSRDTLLPAVYDDRVRKYLIQPAVVLVGVFHAPNPAVVGQFVPGDYVNCPPDPTVFPSSSTARPGVRKVEDAVSTRQPWSRGAPTTSSTVPGYKPSLAVTQDAGASADFGFSNAMLLADSMQIIQGSVSLSGDEEDYPSDSNSFLLSMEALYHPYVRDLQEALASDGLLALYAPPTSSTLFRQLKNNNPFGAATGMGINEDVVIGDLPIEEFDFDFGSSYATYNWEIFYHVPMLLASKLATEQRFDEAQSWYHLMFNPIDIVKGEPGPSKFWRIKPFYEQAGTLAKDQFEIMLGIGATADEQKTAIKEFAKQVSTWEANPFDPHAVARVRPGVYQRALLGEYFDNLIAWADNLFRRDTIESITEATVLYVVVAQLLGQRPQEVPGPANEAKTFAELHAEGLDAFSNAMISLESWIHLPTKPVKKQGCGDSNPSNSWVRVPVVSHFWYFCYPPNPELLKYWDIIEDRMFKIRHCQNIDGVERQLPLFEPPIDPALLVQAAAAGVDIQSVLAELDSGLPPYRFRSVHGRAMAFTNTLKSLGGALLSALEKQDGEQLSRIRSTHELEMLDHVREVRKLQRDEAAAQIDAIERSMAGASVRFTHYTRLIEEGLSDGEDRAFELGKQARNMRNVAQTHHTLAGILGAFPQISVFPPNAEAGGIQLGGIMTAMGTVFSMIASEFEYQGGNASSVAAYERRAQDWAFQQGQASHELGRLQKDLIAAKIRLAIAERELENHALQAEQSQAIDDYMRTKFTNRELYDWMIGQLSTVYFQTYQLAFDLAKRAERAYRHELAISTSEAPIIKFGYWDSLRKGLLAGDKLGHDLERLDLAYMDRDVREFELRKSISLAQLNPEQLKALRETGTCDFDVPEALYDLDHPGHYLRRIRAVRITIPAVVGPYTSLGARLQLQSHKTRFEKSVAPDYVEDPVDGDERFRYGSGAGQAIATSTAMSDGGLFNLDFKDERYLPFEYAGAISSWNLTLPDALRQFDYRTIEDVIIHIDYTARDGGSTLRTEAEYDLVSGLNAMLGGTELAQLVVVQDAFPNEWEQFFVNDGGNHVLTMPVTAEMFPYFARRYGIRVHHVACAMLLGPSAEAVSTFAGALNIQTTPSTMDFEQDGRIVNATFEADTAAEPATLELTVAHSVIDDLCTTGELDPTKVVGMVLAIGYTLTPSE